MAAAECSFTPQSETPPPVFQCAATVVILCIGETHNLINYVSFINYLSYGVTIAGLLYYRWKRPNLYRPIRVPMLLVSPAPRSRSLSFSHTHVFCAGEPAGSCELPDVLGAAAGLQSVLGAGGLRRRFSHHADRRSRLLPGRPLEKQTKVHLQLRGCVSARRCVFRPGRV